MPGLPRADTKKRFNKLLKSSGKSKTNTMYGATATNKNISTKEKLITKFIDFINEHNDSPELINTIREYLLNEYPSDWWDSEFQNRVYDYCSEDEWVGDGDPDDDSTWEYSGPEEAYQNFCNGGAIEYDLIEEIAKDIKEKFHLDDKEFDKNSIYDLIEEHMCNMIDWYDSLIFGKKSADSFGINKGVNDLMKNLDDLTDDGNGIKL